MKKLLILFALLFLSGLAAVPLPAAREKPDEPLSRVLTIEEFVTLATRNDTTFEEILIGQLKTAYRKDLYLPAGDIVLAVKGQYDWFINRNPDRPDAAVSLSKLFPYAGTDLSVSYLNAPAGSSKDMQSELNVLLSQPVAQNAFGQATRLQDRLVGVENDVIRYQVVEAYEDYLSGLIDIYYTWYSAYENLKISQLSYDQTERLLDEMNRRAQKKIALPVDVNKVKLLVNEKMENVITLRELYQNEANMIRQAVRGAADEVLVPADPSQFNVFEVDFDRDYQVFTASSRTYKILGLLEEKSSLEVAKNADDLLPSTSLLLGYSVEGDDWPLGDPDQTVYAGVSLEWPFPDQVARAQYETSRIDDQQTRLARQNKYLALYTGLKNIALQIDREKALIQLADDKISLSEAILKDESRNYSFGKITLNDYLSAVNQLDQNRFSRIVHMVQYKKFLLEWMRVTDTLVDEKVLKE